MIKAKTKQLKRSLRVSSRLLDRSDLPRLLVKRSNQHLHTQIIDRSGKVLAAYSSTLLKNAKMTKTEVARQVGVKLADLAGKSKVKAAVLDRGQYRFHGRVKALVESLNEQGVKI